MNVNRVRRRAKWAVAIFEHHHLEQGEVLQPKVTKDVDQNGRPVSVEIIFIAIVNSADMEWCWVCSYFSVQAISFFFSLVRYRRQDPGEHQEATFASSNSSSRHIYGRHR
ncbi:hypothetical protein NPIL_150251 [Nephila pilipes]|uniref:Uncharacterized protein n=1 Tax=Nephila pilipes TaxID=299642 RepID=A0A8X6PWA3_NEPPI|nr:hypothetical protein NPIL_150251 [Nephila pilipes]